jgi:CheY-like chemotaxis protein
MHTNLSDRRILIVEDEYFVARDLSRVIERMGAQVMGPAPDLASALGLAKDVKLDAAVLDVNLRGGIKVYALADHLMQLGVPFVFWTGVGKDAVPSKYADILICEKPLDADAVARQLAGLLPATERLVTPVTSYTVRAKGDEWAWTVTRGDTVLAQGQAAHRASARAAAMSAAAKSAAARSAATASVQPSIRVPSK